MSEPVDQKLYLVISDLHLGHEGALLAKRPALELLRPLVRKADVLVLLGDLWDFFVTPVGDALRVSQPFFRMIREEDKPIIYLPGNHDYHLVAAQDDTANLLGRFDPDLPFALPIAERLIGRLMSDDEFKTLPIETTPDPNLPEISSAYPLIELAGVRLTHGHYIDPHLGSFGHRTLTWLSRQIAGMRKVDRERFAAADYEALVAPLAELFYRAAQLPGLKAARARPEQLLSKSAGLVRFPARLRRQFRRGEGATPETSSPAIFSLVSPEEAAAAMRQVCENLQIPESPVVFGHTHVHFTGVRAGGWEFHNPGSWLYDEMEMRFQITRDLASPGAVLWIRDGRVSPERVLDGMSSEEIAGLI